MERLTEKRRLYDTFFNDDIYKMVINKDPDGANEVYRKLSSVEPVESDIDWMRPF